MISAFGLWLAAATNLTPNSCLDANDHSVPCPTGVSVLADDLLGPSNPTGGFRAVFTFTAAFAAAINSTPAVFDVHLGMCVTPLNMTHHITPTRFCVGLRLWRSRKLFQSRVSESHKPHSCFPVGREAAAASRLHHLLLFGV
jgi:hypothetical protein